MEELILDLPTMYADHHVIEVRALLHKLAGVAEVYASAAWQRVELTFDPSLVNPAAIRAALQERGYASEAPSQIPVSARIAASTEIAVGPGLVQQFRERIPAAGAAFGPCPGFAVRQPGEVHPADK